MIEIKLKDWFKQNWYLILPIVILVFLSIIINLVLVDPGCGCMHYEPGDWEIYYGNR